jgi:replicative DNA helicase
MLPADAQLRVPTSDRAVVEMPYRASAEYHTIPLLEPAWDAIISIEADGESDVYDLTCPRFSNFVAYNIITHNSIEQDADIVMFIYRDDMYNEASERQNQADIIVAKHRNGPTGIVTLFFRKEVTQFTNMQKSSINLEGF